jgi:hypothetical protein
MVRLDTRRDRTISLLFLLTRRYQTEAYCPKIKRCEGLPLGKPQKWHIRNGWPLFR